MKAAVPRCYSALFALLIASGGQPVSSAAIAQDQPAAFTASATSDPAEKVQAPAPNPAPSKPGCPISETPPQCVPPLTPVKLVLRAHLGSKISKNGEWFEIELAEPIVVNGVTLVPAGTRGMGEVVHAKKSGGSGASGELVLAARYLDIGERRLRLRSLHFAAAGEDRIGTVNTLNVASAASPIPGLSLIGFFIKGKGIDLPEGTLAEAKTAEPFVLEPGVPAAPDPAQTPAATPSPTSSSPPQEGRENAT